LHSWHSVCISVKRKTKKRIQGLDFAEKNGNHLLEFQKKTYDKSQGWPNGALKLSVFSPLFSLFFSQNESFLDFLMYNIFYFK